MQLKKLPIITLTYMSSDGTPVKTNGWRSSHAMGIFGWPPSGVGEGNYSSVMLLPGLVLEDGFASLDQAHAFNLEIERICEVGVIDLEDFFTSVGGREAARRVVEKVKWAVIG